jgi:hypothetical protein
LTHLIVIERDRLTAARQGARSMNATIMTLARLAATKAVKRELQAQGLKPVHIPRSIITTAASDYLRAHPELIEQAAETVRNVPQLRTLAEREERNRKGNRR